MDCIGFEKNPPPTVPVMGSNASAIGRGNCLLFEFFIDFCIDFFIPFI